MSTQKNQNKAPEKKSEWQIPERSQVFLTPGAQKSIEDAQKKGEQVRVVHDRSPERKKRPQSPAPPANIKQTGSRKPPAKREASKENMTLTEAIAAELRDRLRVIRLGIQVNSEDIIKGAVSAILMIIFLLLQTTFFVRFAPFGKVPDLALIFVLAIGVCEGEKWGAVFGLVTAFIIQAMGGSGMGPELLPLIYMPVGCVGGLLSKYYLRHTFPVMASYALAASLLRSIITVITACVMLNASLGEIIVKIALPEYFSTVIISPLPFLSTWLVLRQFHKTRAERTAGKSE
jgi:hypothetical protein